ncbi:metalloreductase STEAP3 [Gastrophryne carolinensis]
MVKSDMAKPLLASELGDPADAMASGGDTLGILGSGDFARSLAARLLQSGYKVVVGSRNPKRSSALFPAHAEVTRREEAVRRARIIFVALFREHYSTLGAMSGDLAGKVLVDVSNNLEINRTMESNAEYLAALYPQCTVVKAFNVISAWALQAGPMDGNKQVLLCSDSPDARCHVASIARTMGFIPVDMGSLRAAREIENAPLRLLPLWRLPAVMAVLLFLFFYLYNFARGVLHPFLVGGKNRFYKMPLEIVNLSLPCTALVLLALVYLPGVLAAIFQLRNGTKYQRFPDWLDRWMIRRKQIGLLSFYCAALHAVYSLCLPLRRAARYQILDDAFTQVKQNVTSSWVEEEVWRMEIYVSLGILALGVLSLLAVSSLPSVASALNWREFTFIQSRLGLVALVLGTLHTLVFGWKRAFESRRYNFYLPPTFTLTLVLPFIVILARAAFLLPCLRHRLARIRRGYEKNNGVKFSGANLGEDSAEGSSTV